MNTHSLDRGTDALYAVVETEALAQKGFTQDEIACLLDFGADPSDVIASLPLLNELREDIRWIPMPPEEK